MKWQTSACWKMCVAPLLAVLLWMGHPSTARAYTPGAMRSDPGLIQAIDHVLELIMQAESLGLDDPELYQALSELTQALAHDRLGNGFHRPAGRAGPFGNGLVLASNEFDTSGMQTPFDAQLVAFTPNGFDAEFPFFQPAGWPGNDMVRPLVGNGRRSFLPPLDSGGQFAFDPQPFTPVFNDLPSSRLVRPTASRRIPFPSAPFASNRNQDVFRNSSRFWPSPQFANRASAGFGDPFRSRAWHRHHRQPNWNYGGGFHHGRGDGMGRSDWNCRHVHFHQHYHRYHGHGRPYRHGWFGGGLATFGRRFDDPGTNRGGVAIPTDRGRPVREIREPVILTPQPPRPASAVIADGGTRTDRAGTKNGAFRNGLVQTMPGSRPHRPGSPAPVVDQARMGGNGLAGFPVSNRVKPSIARGSPVRIGSGPFSCGFDQARLNTFHGPVGRDFRSSTPRVVPSARGTSPVINIKNDPSIRVVNVLRNPPSVTGTEKWRTGGVNPLVQSSPECQLFAQPRSGRLRPGGVSPRSQPLASRQFSSKPSIPQRLPLATVGARVPSFGSGRTSQGTRFAGPKLNAVEPASATVRSNPIGSLAGRPRTTRAAVKTGKPVIGTAPVLNTVRVSPTILNYNSNHITVNPPPIPARTSPLALSGRTGSLMGRAPSRPSLADNVVTQNRSVSDATKAPRGTPRTATPSFPRTNNRIPAPLALSTRQPGSMVGRSLIGNRNQRPLTQGSQRSFQPAPLGGARPAVPKPVASQRVASLTPSRPQSPMAHMARPQQTVTPRLPMTGRPLAPSVRPQSPMGHMARPQQTVMPRLPMTGRPLAPSVRPQSPMAHMARPQQTVTPRLPMTGRPLAPSVRPQSPMAHMARPQQTVTPRLPMTGRPLAPSVRPQSPMGHTARPQQAVTPRLPMTGRHPTAPSSRVAPPVQRMSMQHHRPMVSPMLPMHRYGGVPTPRLHGAHMAYLPGVHAPRPALMPTHYQARRAPQPMMAPRPPQVAPRQAPAQVKGGNVRMAPTGGRAAHPGRR